MVGFVFFLINLFNTDEPIVVARDTTYITAPLRADGLPDYERYFLELDRQGVTPENNAAVPFWKAFWPPDIEPRFHDAMRAELGLAEIPPANERLERLYSETNDRRVREWLTNQKIDTETIDVDEVIALAVDHSWTAAQFPPLAKWVKANQKPIDLLVEASRRPRFYSPSPTLLDDQVDALVSVLLPGAQNAREAARALAARAMLNVGENHLDNAWTDLMAMHRLARLIAQGPTLVEQLVGMAINQMASNGTLVLLDSDRLTIELAQRIKNDLDRLSPIPNVVQCMNEGERLMALDSVFEMRRNGFESIAGERGLKKPNRQLVRAIDWNIVLRRVNHWYDRLVAAAGDPRTTIRRKAIEKLDADLEAEGRHPKKPAYLICAVFSRNLRSELVGSIISCLMIPATHAAITAENRTNTSQQLTRLAAALALYRIQHKNYPANLQELVPGVVEKLPVDHFNARAFVYKRTPEGYVLYSIGDNDKDEQGDNEQLGLLAGRTVTDLDKAKEQSSREQIRQNSDDITIRMPQPKFKLRTSN
jgi:hypothetical protein